MTAQERALELLGKRCGLTEFGREMWPIYASTNTDHMVAKQAKTFLEDLQGRGLVRREGKKYRAV